MLWFNRFLERLWMKQESLLSIVTVKVLFIKARMQCITHIVSTLMLDIIGYDMQWKNNSSSWKKSTQTKVIMHEKLQFCVVLINMDSRWMFHDCFFLDWMQICFTELHRWIEEKMESFDDRHFAMFSHWKWSL